LAMRAPAPLREYVAGFDWSNMAARYDLVYQKMLKG
jgi:hypothetical protein